MQNLFNSQNQARLGYIFMILAVFIGLLTRLVFVFQYVTFDIGPDPDQIRDAFAVMKIWQGHFPTLGPQVSTIGRHHILPLYYYLFFPFTILGADPVFQALPNAFFSFLSIPLFIYLIFSLLENSKTSTRIFLSGLGGLWYSLLFGDIFINNFQWNPSSIPFFILIFSLIYKLQMDEKFSFSIQVILSILQGVTFAILISLHSSTLFVMPAVFLISSAIFIYKKWKQNHDPRVISLPFISLAAAGIALLPYWIGEFGRSFQNTKSILKTISQSSSESNNNLSIGLYEKIGNLVLNYITLAQQAFFWNTSWSFLTISLIFFSIILVYGFRSIKRNFAIWLILCLIWILFLIASSNINALDIPFFYKLSILFLPIILTLSSLAYLDNRKSSNKIIISLIGVFITFSMLSNSMYNYRFMISKYGNNRLMNTADITQVLIDLPSGSTLCDPRIRGKREMNNIYNYINSYITHKEIEFSEKCDQGDFVIHPKRIMLIEGNYLNSSNYQEPYYVKILPKKIPNLFPTFEIIENDAIARPSELFKETHVAYIYRLL